MVLVNQIVLEIRRVEIVRCPVQVMNAGLGLLPARLVEGLVRSERVGEDPAEEAQREAVERVGSGGVCARACFVCARCVCACVWKTRCRTSSL